MWNFKNGLTLFSIERPSPQNRSESDMKDKIQAYRDLTKTMNDQQSDLEVFDSTLSALKDAMEHTLSRLRPNREQDIRNHGSIQDEEFVQQLANLELMLKSYPALPKEKNKIQSAKELEQITQDRIDHHHLVGLLVDKCLGIHQERLDRIKDQIRNTPSLTFSN